MKRRILSCILLVMCYFVGASAQGLPQDKNVKKGVLPNGLTYYICHNAKKPKIADFYIAQRVGAILEEPRQRGLAHFLEHMAFNGTENFPGENGKPGIVEWCETVGIKFGWNLNAYTSVDQTVYNISSAPIVREGVLDSCLLILHDWSHSLLLTDREIDKERGVIHEEWRGGRARAMQRMYDTVLPKMYVDSKYADCLPIGDIDVIDNFKYDALRDYYHKWYRPDLQAIVVVGDFDVNVVEAKIKKLFGAIPKAENPAVREYFPLGDNEKMIVAIGKDKEQTQAQFSLYMKREAYPNDKKNSPAYFIEQFKQFVIRMMLNDRLKELTVKENPPFVNASVGDGDFFLTSTKRAFSARVTCKLDDLKGGLESMIAEVERARQNGFTESELGRAKLDLLSRMESRYNERNKRDNEDIVNDCVENFLSEEPLISLDVLYPMAQKLMSQITLDQVNEYARVMISNQNQVLSGFLPEKDEVKVPSDEELEKIVLDAEAKTYEPYVDKLASTKLIENLRPAGKIVSEKNGKFGMKEFVLSNGVKVYVKSTDYADDDIIMSATSKGGNSLCDEKDAPNFALLNEVVKQGGLGEFDQVSLRKVLAGKNVWVSPSVNTYTESMSGGCSMKDLKTMLELTYLNFTAPRRDDVAFKSYMEKKREQLKHRDANVNTIYADSCRHFLYGDNERTKPVKVETLDKVNYDRVLDIYKQRFADASDFNFVFVGNVNVDSLRPLLETYLASLPVTKSKENFRDVGLTVRKVDEKNVFIRQQDTRSTLVSIYWQVPVAYTPENDMLADVLGQALRIVYTEKVREEKGGTYGVSVRGTLNSKPKGNVMLTVSFRTDPDKYPTLIPIIYEELAKMAQNGPSETNMAKIKEFLVKAYGEDTRTNNYWTGVILDYVSNRVDGNTDYLKRVEKLTSKDVAKFAKKILDNKCRIEVTMTTDELK